MQLPKLAAPPLDFVKSMEQYISEAPRPADAEAHKVRVGSGRRGHSQSGARGLEWRLRACVVAVDLGDGERAPYA